MFILSPTVLGRVWYVQLAFDECWVGSHKRRNTCQFLRWVKGRVGHDGYTKPGCWLWLGKVRTSSGPCDGFHSRASSPGFFLSIIMQLRILYTWIRGCQRGLQRMHEIVIVWHWTDCNTDRFKFCNYSITHSFTYKHLLCARCYATCWGHIQPVCMTFCSTLDKVMSNTRILNSYGARL